MSDSSRNLDQLSPSQSQKETTANELFDAASPSTIFGRRASACAALVFGYYGGRLAGTSIANSSKTATASATNYLVAHRTTLVVSISTSNTNWNDTSTYGRLYKLTAGASSITSYEDHRMGDGGILTRDLTASGALLAANNLSDLGSAATARTNLGLGTAATKADTEYVRVDGTHAFAADQSMGSHKLTNLTDPASSQDAATKAYVDQVASGLDVKQSVRAATTANITLSGAQTIDGVACIAGDRVLVKNQSTGSENGIYVVASGAWSRASDADSSAEVTAGLYAFVSEGTANGNLSFVLTTDDPITLGSTALVFATFSGGGPTGSAGGDLTGTFPNPTIANSAVTVAKMANMAAHTILGNNTGSSAAPIALTLAQARAELLPYVVVTVAYSATTTVDLSSYSSYSTVVLDLTLTGNVTFNLTNGTDGQVIKLRCRQDGTGSRIWTSGANLRFGADVASITLSTAASKLDYIGFQWNGTDSKADVLAVNKGF